MSDNDDDEDDIESSCPDFPEEIQVTQLRNRKQPRSHSIALLTSVGQGKGKEKQAVLQLCVDETN